MLRFARGDSWLLPTLGCLVLVVCCCARSGWGQSPTSSATTNATPSDTQSALRPPNTASRMMARRTTGNVLGISPIAEAAGAQVPQYGFAGNNGGMFEQPAVAAEPQLPPPPQGWLHRFPFIDLHRGDADDPGRHVGLGEPLEGTSWLNRRWSVGWFYGSTNGDDLIDGHVEQHSGAIGGYRIGYDFNHYWGTEGRWAFSNLELSDSAGNDRTRTSRDWFWDMNLLYYPWGDSRWRPYALVGLGWGEYRFVDHQQNSFKDTTVQIPLGVGLKYYFRNWLALRVDLMDTIAFSSEQVDSMHNLSITCGAEFRFGGRRKLYYPWNPGMHGW